jgi:2-C-methyl-D-erythritol 4-phosphate cytidylyltransferase
MTDVTVLAFGHVVNAESVWCIVVAGGSGQRFGEPKQYSSLGDERVIDRARRVAESATDGVVLVVPAADVDREGGVAGGATRSASVRAGLAAVPASASIICVHDAARPLAAPALFEAVIGAVRAGADGAVPGIAVTDTIKVIDEAGRILATPDRATLVAVQTPQAFRADVFRRAHGTGAEGTDDAALVEAIGGTVVVVPGDPANRKLTVAADLDWARRQVATR